MRKKSQILERSAEELAAGFAGLKTRAELAALLEVKVSLLTHVAYREKPPAYYRTWEIKKKSGGFRTIRAPHGSLYLLQAKLNQILQVVHVPKASTHGFVSGRSVATNAKPHVARRFVLNLDLKDFFPTINFGRVRGMFMAKPLNCSPDVATIIAHICCVDNGLAVGAPTSPVVANMVSLRMDAALLRLAVRYGCFYTRYADDITFSTNRPDFPPSLAFKLEDGSVTAGVELRAAIESNGFKVNDGKTRLQPFTGRQEVTGVVVNERLNVDRRFIRQIRAMLHAWNRFGLVACQKEMPNHYTKDRHPKAQPQFRDVLLGKIAYLGMIRGAHDSLHGRYRHQYRNLMAGKPINDGVAVQAAAARPPVDNSPVRILHLSDFHFQQTTAWDASPLLERLVTQVRDAVRPDIVVVTGDVAYSGKAEEYANAEEWFRSQLLPAARIENRDLFFVPGNHDADRKAVGSMVKALQAKLLYNPDDALIASVYADPQEADLLFARFRAYQKFVADMRGEPISLRPWWVQSVSKNGLNIRLAGICSAWLSFQDNEQSRLLIGTPQVLELNREQGDVNIALMHHPEFYFHEADAPAIKEIHNWAHLILRGHLHHESAFEQKDLVNHVVTLAAGCAYQGSKYPNGFQMLQVYGYDRKCQVTPYRWDPAKRRWHRSKDVFENMPDGVGEFQFGSNRRAP